MPYYLVVAGSKLYRMTTAGVASELTLPTDVTIDSTLRARMAVIGRNVAVVNCGSRSLSVTPDGVVRPMQLAGPPSPPSIIEGGSGGLTGTFQAKYTNLVKDPDSGAILAESDFSPTSASLTIAGKLIDGNVAVSPDAATTHRRVYRTTTGPGTVFFPWIDVDGNGVNSFSDDLSDAALALVAAPTELGSAPGMLRGTKMSLITSWKGRLWGVGDVDVDNVRFSGSGIHYGWPATYDIPIAPLGGDQFGVMGFMPRRDELGVARRKHLWKIIGSGPDNFEPLKVKDGTGCIASDSIVIIDDVAYFLGEDGIYSWGPGGVDCVSDGKVRSWFAKGDTFNRAQFVNAFAKHNQTYDTYELHLAAAGSSDIDRWVSFHIKSGTFYGPHKTSKFTPSMGGVINNSDDLTTPVTCGTDGFVYQQNRAAFLDDDTAIAWLWDSKYHDARSPNVKKHWGIPTVLSKIQPASGASTIAVRVGALDANVQQTFTQDQRAGSESYNHCGDGELIQIRFSGSSSELQGCELYGYELPFFEIGGRP